MPTKQPSNTSSPSLPLPHTAPHGKHGCSVIDETKFATDSLIQNYQELLGINCLRPVLLTAITTILGLLPLATGMNINFFTLLTEFDAQIFFGGDNAIFWGPMAWTVIFGLSFATFLTLILVPVMYLLADRIKNKMSNIISS